MPVKSSKLGSVRSTGFNSFDDPFSPLNDPYDPSSSNSWGVPDYGAFDPLVLNPLNASLNQPFDQYSNLYPLGDANESLKNTFAYSELNQPTNQPLQPEYQAINEFLASNSSSDYSMSIPLTENTDPVVQRSVARNSYPKASQSSNPKRQESSVNVVDVEVVQETAAHDFDSKMKEINAILEKFPTITVPVITIDRKPVDSPKKEVDKRTTGTPEDLERLLKLSNELPENNIDIRLFSTIHETVALYTEFFKVNLQTFIDTFHQGFNSWIEAVESGKEEIPDTTTFAEAINELLSRGILSQSDCNLLNERETLAWVKRGLSTLEEEVREENASRFANGEVFLTEAEIIQEKRRREQKITDLSNEINELIKQVSPETLKLLPSIITEEAQSRPASKPAPPQTTAFTAQDIDLTAEQVEKIAEHTNSLFVGQTTKPTIKPPESVPSSSPQNGTEDTENVLKGKVKTLTAELSEANNRLDALGKSTADELSKTRTKLGEAETKVKGLETELGKRLTMPVAGGLAALASLIGAGLSYLGLKPIIDNAAKDAIKANSDDKKRKVMV